MFPSEEFWRSVIFLAIGGIIAVLSLKLWEAVEREKPKRQPQEHDERSSY